MSPIMSMRDFDRLKTIQAVADGNLRAITAASRLQLTRGQVDRYRADGATGLVSRKRGQRHHQLSSDIANMAPRPLSGFWADAGVREAARSPRPRAGRGNRAQADERRGPVDPAPTTVIVDLPHNRRHCVGELVQIDGSEHAWFEDHAPKCTLLVYVDDATSGLLQLHFTPSESTFSYFEATRAYLDRLTHCVPIPKMNGESPPPARNGKG
jgi:hypothetical protein